MKKKLSKLSIHFLMTCIIFCCVFGVAEHEADTDINSVYARNADRQCELVNPVIAASLEGGIELYGESEYPAFVEPCDGPIVIIMKVKNNASEKRYVRFDPGQVSGNKKITQFISDINTFPQPNFFYLNPGDEEQFQLHADFNSNEMKNASSDISLAVTWTVYGYGNRDSLYQISQNDVTTKVHVTSYTQKKIQTDKKLCTATIKGTLKDSSGKPLLIVVGRFYEGTGLFCTSKEGNDETDLISFGFDNSVGIPANDFYTLRYHIGEGNGDYEVYAREDGTFVNKDVRKDGEYLVFKMKDAGTFRIVELKDKKRTSLRFFFLLSFFRFFGFFEFIVWISL